MKFCEQCGAQIPDGALLCPACGRGTQSQPPQPPAQSPQPQAAPPWGAQTPTAAPRPPKASRGSWGGRILFLLLGMVLAGAVTAALLAAGVLRLDSGAKRAAVEGPGYASAEDAARAYAEALKAGDMDAMLATFAVESYVEHFDRAAYFSDIGVVFTGLSGTLMPPADRALGLNLEGRRAQIIQPIYYQYICRLLRGTEYEDSFPVLPVLHEPEDVNALMEVLRQDTGFSGMTIGAALSPEELLPADKLESYQSYLSQRIPLFGAQDMQETCLALTIGGEDYYLFLSAVRYGGKWYNLSFTGNLGGYLGVDSASGGLAPADSVE